MASNRENIISNAVILYEFIHQRRILKEKKMDLEACEENHELLAKCMSNPKFKYDSGRIRVSLIHHRIMSIWTQLIRELKGIWYMVDPNDGIRLHLFVGPRQSWTDEPPRSFCIYYSLTRPFDVDGLYAEGKEFSGSA